MKGNDPSGNLQKSSRRRILSLSAGALATGLAGCIGRQADSDTTPTPTQTQNWDFEDTTGHTWIDDPFDELNTTRSSSGIEITGSGTIDSGMFTEQQIDLDVLSEAEINVSTEGNGLDIYLMNSASFSEYRDRGEFELSEGGSDIGTRDLDQTYQSLFGTYYVVFDNSGVYGSQPQGSVNFEFQITTRASNPLIDSSTPVEVVESAEQPKIIEVQDNFGNTFSFEGDAGDNATVEEEIVVTNDTLVELCVTKIAKQTGDSISYRYNFRGYDRPNLYNTDYDFVDPNCWAWQLQRQDYQSNWHFVIGMKNQDNIEYANQTEDYEVDITYRNLTLSE